MGVVFAAATHKLNSPNARLIDDKRALGRNRGAQEDAMVELRLAKPNDAYAPIWKKADVVRAEIWLLGGVEPRDDVALQRRRYLRVVANAGVLIVADCDLQTEKRLHSFAELQTLGQLALSIVMPFDASRMPLRRLPTKVE